MPQYITSRIALNDISEAEVSYGIKKRIRKAVQYRFLMVEEQSNEWFYLAKILAQEDKNIAFDLAIIYHLENDVTQAIYWYEQAVFLKHEKALVELIDLYIDEGDLLKAKALLLTQKNSDALDKLIDVTITLGDLQLLDELLPLIESPQQNTLINDIQQYQISKNDDIDLINQQANNPNKCRNSIQLFATNLANLHKLDALITSVQQHPISRYFCFNRPRYISIEQLNCSYDTEKAIQCRETVWSQLHPEVNTRYLGLMLTKGGANVNNGILYLDELDDKKVFIHELSHLLGFVDEYPLPSHHKICQKPQTSIFSHNISILKPYYEGSKEEVLTLLAKQIPWFDLIDKTTPLMQQVDNKWKIGTPKSYLFNHSQEIGLFTAETCQNNSTQAFKPTRIKNSLRYYEEPFIELYLHLLNKNPDKYSMPSYHYNVAKSLFKMNKEALGLEWLNKALKREISTADLIENKNKVTRYNKIKLGEY
ncbi:hypothetical protein [Colwellia sp. UCD-KL20]|uniref:hypothetical protein n=1 Tax=Colwellia sp. UCD-KL20 TaxID=1917165 RepID=UPI001177DDFD|nr:hypothetical protein [Colwellia sp. UCD-KL20]